MPQSLIAQTFGEARRLHDLPMASKLALRLNEHNNGYMAMGRYAVWTSDVNRNDKPDLNEAFFIKRERAPDDPCGAPAGASSAPMSGRTRRMLPEFRCPRAGLRRYNGCFARRMLPAVAVAAGSNAGLVRRRHSARASSRSDCRTIRRRRPANQFGIAPHTDSNFMTFLAQTDVPGLQVRMPSGDWLDVPFVPGSFAVNAGDMMQRWTNGRFKSTPHRALPPVGRHRYAVPFFLGPRFDQVIECLPTCTGPDNPPRWAPITYAAWQEYWYDANYDPKAQQDLVA